MKSHFLVLILITIIKLCYAQPENFAVFKFEKLHFLKKGWKGKTFYFKVNGNNFSPDSLQHRIKISAETLDTIQFSFDSTFNDANICYSKFKDGEIYEIHINPCSQYTIEPQNEPKIGQIRFKCVDCPDTIFAGADGSMTSKMINNEETKYFQVYPSAMCAFSAKDIFFSNENSHDLADRDVVTYFHFLHGEKISAFVYGKKKKISLLIDGYIE